MTNTLGDVTVGTYSGTHTYENKSVEEKLTLMKRYSAVNDWRAGEEEARHLTIKSTRHWCRLKEAAHGASEPVSVKMFSILMSRWKMWLWWSWVPPCRSCLSRIWETHRQRQTCVNSCDSALTTAPVSCLHTSSSHKGNPSSLPWPRPLVEGLHYTLCTERGPHRGLVFPEPEPAPGPVQ